VGYLVYSNGSTVRLEEKVERSLPAGEAPKVVIETFNGNVEVARGSDGQVDCVVEKHVAASSQEEAAKDLQAIQVTVAREGDTVFVLASPPPGRRISAGASAVVRVPRNAVLSLKSKNGSVRVERVEGAISANCQNGGIQVEGGRGVLALETSNGGIECRAEDAILAASTSNGPVEFQGTLATGKSQVETSNGSITLRLGSPRPFRVDARATNGRVRSDFDFEPSARSKGRELVAQFGENPETELRLRTSNGEIKILEDE
jgi:DUF4097 and DUF4098 domain-containing protein YvlB